MSLFPFPPPSHFFVLFCFFLRTTECNSTSANRKTTSAKLLFVCVCVCFFKFFKKRKYCQRWVILPLTVAEHWNSQSQIPSPGVICCVNTSLCWKLSSTFFLSCLTMFFLWQVLHRSGAIGDIQQSSLLTATQLPYQDYTLCGVHKLKLFVLP